MLIIAEQICTTKAEGQTIEVKAAKGGCPRKLYDTLSSFSNQDIGGIIVFGINEAESQTEAENRYSGIPTMRMAMKEHGLPEPIFENRRNEFVVTLRNSARHIESKENSEEPADVKDLIDFCRKPKSRQEIAEFLGLKTVFHVSKKYIDPLIKSNELQMTIPEHPKSKNQKFYSTK